MNPKHPLIERASIYNSPFLATAQELLIDECMWNRYDALLWIRQLKNIARAMNRQEMLARLDEIEAGVEAIHLIVGIMDKSKATKPEGE